MSVNAVKVNYYFNDANNLKLVWMTVFKATTALISGSICQPIPRDRSYKFVFHAMIFE